KSKKAYSAPDLKRVQDQLLALQTLYKVLGPERFCSSIPIWILRKEPEDKTEASFLQKKFAHWNKRLVPFLWNRMQRELEAEIGQNNHTLKYRQGGSTSWHIIRRLLIPAILNPGFTGLLVSQTRGFGAKHFDILKRADRHFMKADPFDDSKNTLAQTFHANLLHKEYSSRHEIIFDALDSRVTVETAEDPEAGQGIPGVAAFVATELSRWPHNPKETYANIVGSVTPHGTKDTEWTANGLGGFAYEEYMKAKNGQSTYKAHFFPWPYAEEYIVEDLDELRSLEKKWEAMADEISMREEKSIRKFFRLTDFQMGFRRKMLLDLGDEFYEKYPEDDATAFLTSGNSFFDKVIIRERMKWCQAHVKPLDQDEATGWILFKKPLPKRQYILHADVAEGKTISTPEPDFSFFTVIDLDSGEQMARYRNRVLPEDYAYHISDIAKLFNMALVGVENNPGGGGETVLVTLKTQLSYPNIYQHKLWWKAENKVVEVPGLPTTSKTRPLMLNKLAFMLREHPELFYDVLFFEEALSFVRGPTGRPAAAPGCYDDSVLSAAGAHFIRLIRLGLVDPVVAPKEAYGAVQN
ncbi:MAG: hypothetical protein KGI50_07125, partial [Patescibacteria group bacterium]|nr:hypothetical protein [Patescibacteria group bacterium]